MHVFWSHGKESGPWGSKLTALVEVARDLGFEADSLDYRGMADPDERTEKLVARCNAVDGPLVLAGSSMGGYVATAAACKLDVLGLFLLAPALYWPGRELSPSEVRAKSFAIVHGWRDDVLPPENSFRFAQSCQADLHLIDGDHRLRENLPELKRYFTAFLEKLKDAKRVG